MSEVWGELVCGHKLLMSEDSDARADYCPDCQMWLSFVAFHESGGS